MPKVGDVETFMRASAQRVPNEIQLKLNPQSLLYWKLCEEEYEELTKAFDILRARSLEDTEAIALELAEVADGVADLIWVAIGLLLSMGIPVHAIWDEVAKSNLLKINPQTGLVEKREDGKVMKPAGWKPPQIAAFIERRILLAKQTKGV